MLPIFFIILFCVSTSNAVPLTDFFPYGLEVGDSLFSSSNSSAGPLHLPYDFYYFDNAYRQIWITKNGLFSFRQPPFYYTYPQSLPALNNHSFVTGFWFAFDGSNFNSTENRNRVYYQIHNNRSASNSSINIFDKASDYVRKFFPQQRPFQPKMVITGTWYYISNGTNETEYLNNTFQVVLCTDEDRSFVFFLYYDLQWSDPFSNIHGNYNARAGVYHGNGNKTETLPYSGTDDIIKLANESNVNVPGLFAFRIDADRINAGGCNETTSTVSFRPRIGSQLGSTPLSVYGPCFTNQTQVKCQFNSSSQVVDGIVIDEFRAICLTPFSSLHGSIPISVSVDNGQTYISAGTYTYAPLKLGSDEVTIETEDGDNLITGGQYVKLKWYISETMKKTFPNDTKLDIELWNASLNDQSQLQKDNQPIILQTNLNLTDTSRVQLPSSISYTSTCFIRVKIHFNSKVYAGLNTGLLIVRSSPSIATERCQNWVDQQPEPSTWNNDGLFQCPMTRSQAIAAGRCCYKLDQLCYQGSTNPNNCWFHQARVGHDEPSAVECYMSITSNRHGAGAKCCYDNSSMLITRGTGAGTDDRYILLASPVKHIFYDTLSYFQCCLMNASLDMCNKYMDYRPPRRGSNTMGQTGRMWGDPHFGTLDGSSYTFNGHGEYTYLAISNNNSSPAAFDDNTQSHLFISQIRTIPLSTGNATVTRGFAARSNSQQGESVSVTISRHEHLILHRGDQSLEFEDSINTLTFPELIITRLDGTNHSHFTFSWLIGVTIEIKVIQMTTPSRQLVLDIAASVDGSFRGRTYGLLGTYDGIVENDLRSKNGTIIRNNATLEQIHKDFGITWAINSSNSLFYYQSNESAAYFEQQNHLFIPSFIDPLTATNNQTIRQNCGINATSLSSSWSVAQRTCYYDLAVTNDVNFAKTSLSAGNELLSIRENQRNPPSFNASLPLSMNLNRRELVHLNMSASSEYPSHTIKLILLHLPQNATFNNVTGIFRWIAITGEHYLSIEARDTTYNLSSTRDIAFNVKDGNEMTTNPTTSRRSTTTHRNSSHNHFSGINYLVFIIAIFILF